jgi:hypothetical protein
MTIRTVALARQRRIRGAGGHSSWATSRRSPFRAAGGVRIGGSGTRSSSLLDRSERSATPCLLITLAGGASAGGGPPC